MLNSSNIFQTKNVAVNKKIITGLSFSKKSESAHQGVLLSLKERFKKFSLFELFSHLIFLK